MYRLATLSSDAPRNGRFTHVRSAIATVAVSFAVMAVAAPAAVAQTVPTAPPAMSGHASADAAQMLVNFITSVNRDEIALGKLAVTKSTSAEVRAYAQRMIDDHTNAMAAWAAKVPSWSLTIPDSAKTVAKPMNASSAAMANGVSEVRDTTTGLRGGTPAAAIHSANLAAMDQLRSLSGAAFDSVYIDAQKSGHEAVLKELSSQQPNSNQDMQTLIALYRKTVEKHATDAAKLRP